MSASQNALDLGRFIDTEPEAVVRQVLPCQPKEEIAVLVQGGLGDDPVGILKKCRRIRKLLKILEADAAGTQQVVQRIKDIFEDMFSHNVGRFSFSRMLERDYAIWALGLQNEAAFILDEAHIQDSVSYWRKNISENYQTALLPKASSFDLQALSKDKTSPEFKQALKDWKDTVLERSLSFLPGLVFAYADDLSVLSELFAREDMDGFLQRILEDPYMPDKKEFFSVVGHVPSWAAVLKASLQDFIAKIESESEVRKLYQILQESTFEEGFDSFEVGMLKRKSGIGSFIAGILRDGLKNGFRDNPEDSKFVWTHWTTKGKTFAQDVRLLACHMAARLDDHDNLGHLAEILTKHDKAGNALKALLGGVRRVAEQVAAGTLAHGDQDRLQELRESLQDLGERTLDLKDSITDGLARSQKPIAFKPYAVPSASPHPV